MVGGQAIDSPKSGWNLEDIGLNAGQVHCVAQEVRGRVILHGLSQSFISLVEIEIRSTRLVHLLSWGEGEEEEKVDETVLETLTRAALFFVG